MIFWFLICAWAAPALQWEGEISSSAYVSISIFDQQNHKIVELLTADNRKDNRFFNCKDLDPREKYIRGELSELWLPAGEYKVVEQWPDHQKQYSFVPESAPRQVELKIPANAIYIQAWKNNGFAWTKAEQGQTVLPLGAGSWDFFLQDLPYKGSIHSRQKQAKAHRNPKPFPRQTTHSHSFLWQAPLLLCALFLLRGLRWKKKWFWGLGTGLILMLLSMGDVFFSVGERLLNASGPITDPSDSVALLATIQEGLFHMSDTGKSFRFPEGISWMGVDSSWMGYLLPALISSLSNPLIGHNFGVGLGWFLLGFCLCAIGQAMGFRSLIAMTGALLGGVAVMDESDAISLDRASLFLIPLCWFLLNHALEKGGKKAIYAAGFSMGFTLSFQIYYGVFFALAAPFFCLIRIPLHGWKNIFKRAIPIALIAFVFALPAIHNLKNNSNYTIQQSSQKIYPHQIDPLKAKIFINRQQNRTQKEMRLHRPGDRMLTASSLSISAQDFLLPRKLLPMGSWFWPVAALCIFFARQRKQCAIQVADVGILMILGLGPALYLPNNWTGIPLPHLLAYHHLPGVDQLKNIHRFGLLAAVIASIPLIGGLDGLTRKLPKIPAYFPTICIIIFCFFQIPKVHFQAFPISSALRSLQGGNAIFLPLAAQTPPWISIPAVQHHLQLVNPPPFEFSQDAPTSWSMDIPLLNQLDLLSENGESNTLLLTTPHKQGILHLSSTGLQWVVLPKNRLQLESKFIQVLDQHLTRYAEDNQYLIWKVSND